MFTGPSLDRLLHLLFSERGLLVATPLVIIGLVGIWFLFRRGKRFDAIIAGSALIAMIGVQMAWGSSFAGGPGPRYVIPALPFLAAPLAVAWARWRRLTFLLVAVSAATMISAMLTKPQLGSSFSAGLGDWLATLFAGDVAPNWYAEALGLTGWLLHGMLVAAASAFLIWVLRGNGLDAQSKNRMSAPVSDGPIVE